MKILTFIPVYNRRHITETCYKALKRLYEAAPDGMEFKTLILASTLKDAKLAHEYGLDVLMVNNKPVGQKLNTGLAYALEKYKFDYLFQLNSDNVLHVNFWDYFTLLICENRQFFGCNHIAFYDSESRRLLKYLYMNGCGIRFIRRDVLEGAAVHLYLYNQIARAGIDFTLLAGTQWVPKARARKGMKDMGGLKVQLWPPDKNSGLDDASSRAIRRAYGKSVVQVFPYQESPQPLVIDIKSKENIHPFSEFENEPKQVCQEVKGNDKADLLKFFPELEEVHHLNAINHA